MSELPTLEDTPPPSPLLEDPVEPPLTPQSTISRPPPKAYQPKGTYIESEEEDEEEEHDKLGW